MELKLTPLRVLLLIAVVALFWFVGGFEPPTYPDRSWVYRVVLYLGGAVCMSVIDHWVGTLDRSNMRFLYIIFGILCCGISLLCLYVFRERDQMLHDPPHRFHSSLAQARIGANVSGELPANPSSSRHRCGCRG